MEYEKEKLKGRREREKKEKEKTGRRTLLDVAEEDGMISTHKKETGEFVFQRRRQHRSRARRGSRRRGEETRHTSRGIAHTGTRQGGGGVQRIRREESHED